MSHAFPRFGARALFLSLMMCTVAYSWVPSYNVGGSAVTISSSAAAATSSPLSLSRLSMAGRTVGRANLFDYDVDFYKLLNVTRGATNQEIRGNYLLLAKEWEPKKSYREVEELRFDPASLRVKQLKAYLEVEKVNTATCVEKSDLVNKAKSVHARNGHVDDDLKVLRKPIAQRYELLQEAYDTLSDKDLRRKYNLSGDWGIPGLPGKFMPKFMTDALTFTIDSLGGIK